MKVINVVILFFVVCTIGCAHNTTGSFYKPGVDFTKSMKIAVVKFNNTEHPASGQEAADSMAMAFLKNGFDVIEINQILSPSEQNKIYYTGLTDEVKKKLKNFGVNYVILGRINEYYCSNVSSDILNLYTYHKYFCRVTFSVKMIDLISGEILWGLSISDEKDGDNLKADIVLRSMIREMDKEIPVYLSNQINRK